MCRVALINKKGEKEIERIYGLTRYLKFLEKQFGGHGNGFSLMKNGKIIKLEKGVKLDVRDIANEMKNTDYDWALFHTRLASVGDKNDRNCHPFRRGTTVLAMNGTERSVEFLSHTMDITDTEAILETITKYHLGLVALKNFHSIFMGFYNKKPFVFTGNTQNIKVLNNRKKRAIVFASSFPNEFKNTYETTEKFLWTGGNLPNTLVKSKKIHFEPRFFSNYLYHDDLYGQCYLEALEREELEDAV